MTKVFNDNADSFIKVGNEAPSHSANIAFYETPDITPEKNITVLNNIMTMNKRLSETDEADCFVNEDYILFKTNSDERNSRFYSRGLYITDKTMTDNDKGIYNEPVYFQYKLRYNHLDSTISEVENNIDVIDENGKKISRENYFYYMNVNKLEGQVNNKNRFEITIYTNFKPKEKSISIEYKPEHPKLSSYKEKLNPVELYTRVSNDDFYNNYLDTAEKVYTIERLSEGFQIKVPLRAYLQYRNNPDTNDLYDLYNNTYDIESGFTYDTKKYFVKFKDSSSKIYAKVNNNFSFDDEWSIGIHYDSFVNNTGEKKYIYDIPEFYYQDINWNNGVPSINVQQELAVKLGDNKLKTKYNPLFIESTTVMNDYITPSNIDVKDEDGLVYTTINWSSSDGEVEVLEDIPDNKKMYISYDYIAEFHEYNGYYDENGNFIHLDLNPRTGHFYTEKKIGQGIVNRHKPTYQLANKMIYIYLKPEYVIEDNEKYRNQFTLFHTIDHDLHEDPNHPLINEDLGNVYSLEDIKLVAKIFVTPVSNSANLKVIDTRSRGGGIKDGLVDTIKEMYDEVGQYWDITNWNGTFYPSNGVVVIELPKSILDKFSSDEVKAKIKKHLALGILPVIQYK